MGDSFLWEGSLFVFQYVGGDGRGHILSIDVHDLR